MGENRDPGIGLESEPIAEKSPEQIRAELQKILASQAFRSAHAQQAFLRYVVEEAVAGRAHQIKECIIGMEAFGRGTSFDPRLDPIVRTQAAKLRARLARYYETEGVEDSLRIEFRKGSYAPLFRRVIAPAPVREPASVATPPELPRVAAVPPAAVPQKSRSRSSWKGVAVLIAVLALTGSGSAAFYAFRSGWRERLLPANAPSVAVLPFVNLGNGSSDEFLSDGLADQVIHSLRQVPGLQVVARTSAFRFKGKEADLANIGRKLHVRTVLVGSVQRSRNHLRITVQLNSIPDNYHLWSGEYDVDGDDVRSVPSEIAGVVTGILGVESPPGAAKIPARKVSPTPSAYRNYLKGVYFWNKFTPDGLKTATRYLEQAIADDPSFAPAYAALAQCYAMAPQVGTALPPEVVSRIRAAATRALQLDPTLGEAHFDLAILAEFDFDWVMADAEFRKGLELSPGNAVGHLWYAKYLALVGRRDEVLLHRRIAAELDPVSPYAVQALGGYLSVTGRYDEAIRQFSSALALEPDFGLAHQGLGMAYLLDGREAEAIEEFQKADRLMSGPRRKALLGWAYGVSGKKAEARRILHELLDQANHESFPALAIAQIYIGLGEKDRAFEWLERAVDQRDLDVTLKWDSPYEPLRSDPRYTALLHRMKLS